MYFGLLENNQVVTLVSYIIVVVISIITLIILLLHYSDKKQSFFKSQIEDFKIIHEQEILKTKLEIQENIFNKISKEIHDNISLGLTLAKLQLNNEINNSIINKQKLESSIDLISKSLIDLNDLSKSLDANSMLSHGLIHAIESEIAIINRSGIIDASLEVIGESFYLDTETELVLLRIFQESVNNIIKHAKASKINTFLIFNKESLELKVADNGKGFDITQILESKTTRKMSGLNNIKNRAQLIGSDSNIISVPNIGTTVSVKTPIKKT